MHITETSDSRLKSRPADYSARSTTKKTHEAIDNKWIFIKTHLEESFHVFLRCGVVFHPTVSDGQVVDVITLLVGVVFAESFKDLYPVVDVRSIFRPNQAPAILQRNFYLTSVTTKTIFSSLPRTESWLIHTSSRWALSCILSRISGRDTQ